MSHFEVGDTVVNYDDKFTILYVGTHRYFGTIEYSDSEIPKTDEASFSIDYIDTQWGKVLTETHVVGLKLAFGGFAWAVPDDPESVGTLTLFSDNSVGFAPRV